MKTWIISDTHFGHQKVYTDFIDRYTGENLRPWAATAAEGDEYMRDMWAERIKPTDRVYHLGDVAIPRRGLRALDGLSGRKILIRGNHDIFKLKDYAEHFDDIRGTHKLDKFILSHYPIHIDSIPHWCVTNIHGHTHSDHVWVEPGVVKHERYRNVCVEQTLGIPIEFEQLRSELLNS
jgi:calcineurin-like phosphoesterase family protein